MTGAILAAVLLAVPSLAASWAMRRRSPVVVSLLVAPPARRAAARDLRTPEQRAADQARFDAAFPRGGAA